jgi:glutamyl-tRNA reductase
MDRKEVLEHLGVVGVSWRQGSSESLAGFKLAESSESERLKRFAAATGVSELAYLATCNRVEIIFAHAPGEEAADLRPQIFELLTGGSGAAGEAQRRLRAWGGEGAAEHLFMVAAGLDSACVGEAEIVGQVRRCHELSLQLGLCGPNLELLFAEALKIAAQVRGETGLGRGRVSLAEIAVKKLRERLAVTPGRVALVGVSPMTERAALALAADHVPLTVVNRSTAKAAALAAQHGAEHCSLEEFRAEPPAIEALLTATGAGEPILLEPTLERLAALCPSGRAPLVIDMAVPGDTSAEACAKLDIPRIGMNEIVEHAEHNRASRLMEAAEARQLVDEALADLQETFAERLYGPLFAALQQRYRRTAEEGVKRLLRKELKGLGDAERAAIDTWAEVLARRFAHIPCLGLRGLLHHGPEGSLSAFLDGLDPEFAAELRQAINGTSERVSG